MVPYKKIGLIVKAFTRMPDKKLIVIGDGPCYEKTKSKATSNVKMLGYQPTSILRRYMQRARAFVFAAEEDFGIIPIEAQACGTPVIAYGKGGIRDTVIENKTGLFFEKQEADSIIDAVERFERKGDYDPVKIRLNAERFSNERFLRQFKSFVDSALEEHMESIKYIPQKTAFVHDRVKIPNVSIEKETVRKLVLK